jgi:hypothetical protein
MSTAKNQRQPFTSRGPFIVGRGFTWSGKPYVQGDAFPHNRLAIDHRKLRQLWDQRRLEVASDYLPAEDEVKEADAAAAAIAASEQVTADEATETSEGEDTTDATTEDTVEPKPTFNFNPEEHVIDKDGREYWISDADTMLLRVRADFAKSLEEVTEVTLVPADQILEWPEE